MSQVTWKGEDFLAKVSTKMYERMDAVADYLVDRIKKKLSTTGSPSSPGNPPHLRTGDLRDSITAVDSAGLDLFAKDIGSNLEYSTNLEYGTSKMAPRPFLRQTLCEEQQHIADIMLEGL
jgi:hypothetical protein